MYEKIPQFVVAMRPWSFTASATPLALGSLLAYKTNEDFSLGVFIFAGICAVCVQAAGNFVNTYYDFERGIDNKQSDDRTLVDGTLSPREVATLGALCYTFGCVSFLMLSFVSVARMEHLVLIYFCGLFSSFFYTGGIALKYIALGDLVIFLTFGPLTVTFGYLSQTGSFSFLPILYGIPLAMNAEAMLHGNNVRDVETDRKAGIVTMAILMGKTGSYIMFIVLIFTPYLMFSLMGLYLSLWMFIPVLSIPVAFKLHRKYCDGNHAGFPQSIAFLNLVLGFLYFVACFLSPNSAFRMPI